MTERWTGMTLPVSRLTGHGEFREGMVTMGISIRILDAYGGCTSVDEEPHHSPVFYFRI